jgi:hypothetical protein
MTRRYRAKVTLVLMVLSGCGKVHSGDTPGLREPKGTLEGRAGSLGDVSFAMHVPIDASSSTATQGDTPRSMPNPAAIGEPDAASTMLATDAVDGGLPTGVGLPIAATEIWIGQLRSDELTLCDPLADVPLGSSLESGNGPSIERVVLILQHDERKGLSGQIQFGQGMPPPAAPDFNGRIGFWKCSHAALSKGFEYTLVAPVLTSERLTFAIVPNEIWDRWCTTQLDPCTGSICQLSSEICSCKGGTCRANPSNRFTISLAVTADTIEGVVPLIYSNRGTSAEVRLRRVQ